MVQMLLFFFFLLWKIIIHHIWHRYSAPKFFAMTYDNKIFCIITTLLKSFKTHSAQVFSQLKVLVYADILYLHSVHGGMHIICTI